MRKNPWKDPGLWAIIVISTIVALPLGIYINREVEAKGPPVRFKLNVIETNRSSVSLVRKGGSWNYRGEVLYFDHPKRSDYECIFITSGRLGGLSCIPKDKK